MFFQILLEINFWQFERVNFPEWISIEFEWQNHEKIIKEGSHNKKTIEGKILQFCRKITLLFIY